MMQASRNLSNAAGYLRDPYRGDDFEKSTIGGMRSSQTPRYGSRTQHDTRVYDNLLDDSLREDDYAGRGNTNATSRQGTREPSRTGRQAYRH